MSSTLNEHLEIIHANPELDKDQRRNLALVRKRQDRQEDTNS